MNNYCEICGELITRNCPNCQLVKNCTDCNGTGEISYPCHHINPIENDNGSRTIEYINTWMIR
jgi:hypothetical protein